jgi:CheY-like chemotaxis protein
MAGEFLIADDSPDKREFMRRAVSEVAPGLEVIEADTSRRALEIIDAHFDRIVGAFVDMDYPPDNGPFVIRRFRSMEAEFGGIRPIALVTNARESLFEMYADLARDAGATTAISVDARQNQLWFEELRDFVAALLSEQDI